MIPVQDVLPTALAEVLRRAPLTPEKVSFAWRQAVGPAVDRVTATDFRAGVLIVHARDANWRREIQRSLPLVRSRMEKIVGPDAIARVEIVVAGQ